ncbi:hypothetical protein ABD87_00120 [Lysinibacillus sphaericus]|uniref:hypothetical protein n=1 Tax=Lysinibacillus sphaericus TaxID=1421 RepID=UPI0018CCF9E4|nr:hypothetical protein [Lysinibacillus sphaericus]MBG9727997.1 hypothetical protein [Lysinibacillus sphaericus]
MNELNITPNEFKNVDLQSPFLSCDSKTLCKQLIQEFITENKLLVHVHYFPFKSELNDMGNQWNIFLDSRNSGIDMLSEFMALIKKFMELEKALPL